MIRRLSHASYAGTWRDSRAGRVDHAQSRLKGPDAMAPTLRVVRPGGGRYQCNTILYKLHLSV